MMSLLAAYFSRRRNRSFQTFFFGGEIWNFFLYISFLYEFSERNMDVYSIVFLGVFIECAHRGVESGICVFHGVVIDLLLILFSFFSSIEDGFSLFFSMFNLFSNPKSSNKLEKISMFTPKPCNFRIFFTSTLRFCLHH